MQRELRECVARALAEDVGTGDLTALLVSPDVWAKASIISREPAVLCGSPWVDEVFAQLGGKVSVRWLVEEGGQLLPDQPFCELQGEARSLLTGERTALNFLQMMSAVATESRKYVQAIEGTGAQLLDTRKTLPGLRHVQKYATRCGGCRNHRMGLYDAILIKENHIASAGSIAQAVAQARTNSPGIRIEVEVETLEQLAEAMEARVESALLDNFSFEQMREAVKMNGGVLKLEASGNVTLETLREIALTGVDYISVGALTKNVRAIDLSMRIEQQIFPDCK
jgi:nicotinate-nucleotide pyrophosphorylase (carboxylating)